MTQDEITNLDDLICSEGFEFGLEEYAYPNSRFLKIKDVEFHNLREAWLKAKQNLINYLKEQGSTEA